MGGYLGLGTRANIIRWALFVGLKVLAAVFAIIYLFKLFSYELQFENCIGQIDYFSYDFQEEKNQCVAKNNSHVGELNTYLALSIVCGVVPWILFCIMCRFAERPSHEESLIIGATSLDLEGPPQDFV